MEVGTTRQFLWLKWVIGLTFILNAIDGVLTVAWVLSGHAQEANPIMDHLLDVDPVVFIVVKLTLVALGSFLLWRLRRIPAAVVAIFLLFIVYYSILVYHAQAFADIVFPEETIEESVPRPERLKQRFHRRS
jgi:MFS superfamily sulfate permease-like transporter